MTLLIKNQKMLKNADILKRRKKKDMYAINEYKYDTSTVLHIAIQKGNIDIIQLLLTLPQIELISKSTSFYKTCKHIDLNQY